MRKLFSRFATSAVAVAVVSVSAPLSPVSVIGMPSSSAAAPIATKPTHVTVGASRQDLMVIWDNLSAANHYVIAVHTAHLKGVEKFRVPGNTRSLLIPWGQLPGRGRFLYRVTVTTHHKGHVSAPKWQDGFTTPKDYSLQSLMPLSLKRVRGTRFYSTSRPKAIYHPKTVHAERKSVKHCVADGAYAGGAAGGTTAAVGWVTGPFELAETGIAALGGAVGGFVVCMSDR